MNKSHLLNPNLGLKQPRPSSGRPFFESPTLLDPALFPFLFSFPFFFILLLFFIFVIMRKLQQTKDRVCQVPCAQAFRRGLRWGLDSRHGTKASHRCQGGKMKGNRGQSRARRPRVPCRVPPAPQGCRAPAGTASTYGPNCCHLLIPFGVERHRSWSVAKT